MVSHEREQRRERLEDRRVRLLCAPLFHSLVYTQIRLLPTD